MSTEADSFVFPAGRLADAQARVERYARKAERVGLPAPSLRVVAEFQRTTFINERGEVSHGKLNSEAHSTRNEVEGFAPVNPLASFVTEDFVLVEVEGERPIIRGFEFAATIEHTDEGNFVWGVPGFAHHIPLKYRDVGESSETCDHCGYRRTRNKTYLLRSVETGDFMRVGSSCLQDHLGHAGPTVWLNCYQWLRELADASEDIGSGLSSYVNALAVPVQLFIAGVIVYCRGFGFVSKARADERNPSTAGQVLFLLSNPKKAAELRDLIDEAAYAKAGEILAWLSEQDADSSGFIHNAQLAAKLHVVRLKTAGVLAAIVPSFDRELARKQITEQRLNEHLPNASKGERVVVDLTVEKITSWPTDFGYTTLLVMSDAEGRAFAWRTSNGAYDVSGDEVEAGNSYRVLGTVKYFGDYKGTKQTALARCKLFEAGETEDKSLRTAMRKLCKARSEDVPVWAMTDAQRRRAAKKSTA